MEFFIGENIESDYIKKQIEEIIEEGKDNHRNSILALKGNIGSKLKNIYEICNNIPFKCTAIENLDENSNIEKSLKDIQKEVNNILVDHIYYLPKKDGFYKASLKIQEINRIIDCYLFARKSQGYEAKFSSLSESKDADEEEIQMDLAEKEVFDFKHGTEETENIKNESIASNRKEYYEESDDYKKEKPKIPSIDDFLDWVYERGEFKVEENVSPEEKKRQQEKAAFFPFDVDIFKEKTQVKSLFGKETWVNYATRNLMRKSVSELQEILLKIQEKNEFLKREIEAAQRERTMRGLEGVITENKDLESFKEKEKVLAKAEGYDAMQKVREMSADLNQKQGGENENLDCNDLQNAKDTPVKKHTERTKNRQQ